MHLFGFNCEQLVIVSTHPLYVFTHGCYLSCVVNSVYKKLCSNLNIPYSLRLRCCATNRQVAGSIPAGVSGFFIVIKSFRSHYGPGVDSVSNRNEYQEHFLEVKAAGA